MNKYNIYDMRMSVCAACDRRCQTVSDQNSPVFITFDKLPVTLLICHFVLPILSLVLAVAFICFYNSSSLLLLFLEFCVVYKALQVASGYETCFIHKFAVAVWEKLANSQRMNGLEHNACTLTLKLGESTQNGGRDNRSRISMAESCKEKSRSLKANCVAESRELAALVWTQIAPSRGGDRGPPSLTSTVATQIRNTDSLTSFLTKALALPDYCQHQYDLTLTWTILSFFFIRSSCWLCVCIWHNLFCNNVSLLTNFGIRIWIFLIYQYKLPSYVIKDKNVIF